MREPQTRAEWQEAVDAAQAMLTLQSSRQYGLVRGGPAVKEERCIDLIARGKRLGVKPAADCVERLVAELVAETHASERRGLEQLGLSATVVDRVMSSAGQPVVFKRDARGELREIP